MLAVILKFYFGSVTSAFYLGFDVTIKFFKFKH